jgi:hypothetical protein
MRSPGAERVKLDIQRIGEWPGGVHEVLSGFTLIAPQINAWPYRDLVSRGSVRELVRT